MATTYDDPTLVREPPGTPLPTPSPAATALRDDALAQRAAAHDAAAVPAEAAGIENLPEEPPLPSGRGLTALADILRPPSERVPSEEPAPPAPTGPSWRPRSAAMTVANQLLGQQMTAYDRADELRRQQAAAEAPFVEAAHAAQQRFVNALGQSQKFPTQPVTTPPPSRKLRDFMEPIDGEHPAKAIGRLIQAMGLFAMGIGGIAKGYVGAGLAGLVGAMQGWQEGDAVRADRAFADWKEQTDHAVKEWEREKNAITEAMTNANMELEQRFKLVQLTGLMYQNKIVAELGRAKDLDGMMKYLKEVADSEGKLDTEMAKVFQSVLDRQQKEQFHRDTQDLARQKLDLDRRQTDIDAAYKLEQTDQGRARLAQEAEKIKISREELALKEKELLMGKPTPEGLGKAFIAVDWGKTQLTEISRLASLDKQIDPATGKPRVNLGKVMGGMQPWLVEAAQKDRVGLVPARFIPGASMQLTSEEEKLVSMVNDYVDSVIRIRTGAALPSTEYEKMAGFLPVLALRPESFKERIALAQEALDAQRSSLAQNIRGMGYRVPTTVIPSYGSAMTGWSATPRTAPPTTGP